MNQIAEKRAHLYVVVVTVNRLKIEIFSLPLAF